MIESFEDFVMIRKWLTNCETIQVYHRKLLMHQEVVLYCNVLRIFKIQRCKVSSSVLGTSIANI